MKTFYTVIGAALFWLWVLGHLNLIDFHLCVGAVGACNPPSGHRWMA